MKHSIFLSTAFFFFSCTCISAQTSDPIWGIGTKWTYGLQIDDSRFGYATDEIVDTVTINNRLLYVVESEPDYHGIQYFYYEGGKVFNYKEDYDYLHLLYDFEIDDTYTTDYRPICDPYFDHDNLVAKTFTIQIDSVASFLMPDGSVRDIKYYTSIDSIITPYETQVIENGSRSILDGIGFMQGGIHHTHDWELGQYVCDEFANYIMELRCFENDSVFYNFAGIACDSTWIKTATDNIEKVQIEIFPNPTTNCVTVSSLERKFSYEVYTPLGNLIDFGTSTRQICLNEPGLNILRIKQGGEWLTVKVFKAE
jgi:hypothetical protein